MQHLYIKARHKVRLTTLMRVGGPGNFLLAADRDHGLGTDELLLFLVQFGTAIVYKDRHDDV